MVDKDNSKLIPYDEFAKVIGSFKFGIKERDINALFTAFDVTKIDAIDYEEFLKIIKVNRM